MSRIVVLGGAGIIGQAIVQDLVEDVSEVVVADLDAATAQKVAERFGGGCVAQGVDVTKPDQLDAVLFGADACINSAQYYFNLDVMMGCLRKRSNALRRMPDVLVRRLRRAFLKLLPQRWSLSWGN